MNISITFRHMEASEAIKAYAREKVARLQRFLRQPMTARVTVSIEKHEQVVETRVSSGGERLEAREASPDLYASIDKLVDKLERQIRASKGSTQAKGRRETVRGTRASAVPPAPVAPPQKPAKKAAAKAPKRKAAKSSASTRGA